MSELYKKEDKLQKLIDSGNFNKALELLKDLIETSDDLDDRVSFRNKYEELKKIREEYYSLDIGEAYFPVYDSAKQSGTIRVIQVEKKNDENTALPEGIVNCIRLFLDSYIKRNIIRLKIFDYTLNGLGFKINEMIGNEQNKDVNGKSYELALLLAVLSYLFDVKISENFVFSSRVKEGQDSVKLNSVNHLEEKFLAIKEELGKNVIFVVPGSCSIKNNNILCLEKVEDAVNKVFPLLYGNILDRKNIFEDKIYLHEPRKTSIVSINKDETAYVKDTDKEVWVLKFEHAEKLRAQTLPGIYEFFKDIANIVIHCPKAAIDGLKPNYLVPLLLCQKEVAGHIKEFIAVLNTPWSNNDIHTAVVVKTNAGGRSGYKEGDLVYYRREA